MLTKKEQFIFDTFQSDFYEFLKERINQFIKDNNLQITVNSSRFLKKADCNKLLRAYLYNKQKVPSGKKKVHYSKEIQQSPLYRAFRKRISVICNRLEKGYSIAQYLTAKTNNLEFEDKLLNDWGITHIHIQPVGQRSIATDGILLFAYFYVDAVFLLNIGNHRSFTDKKLLEIMDVNWPNLLENFNNLKAPDLKDTEIMELRKNNIAYTLSINGKTVPTQIPYMRDRMMIPITIFRELENIAKIVVANIYTFQKAIAISTKENRKLEMHLYFDNDNGTVRLYDKYSTIGFRLDGVDCLDIFSNIL